MAVTKRGDRASVVLEAMHAAGIGFESSPENYQLTTVGEQISKMVFWGARRASVAAPADPGQNRG